MVPHGHWQSFGSNNIGPGGQSQLGKRPGLTPSPSGLNRARSRVYATSTVGPATVVCFHVRDFRSLPSQLFRVLFPNCFHLRPIHSRFFEFCRKSILPLTKMESKAGMAFAPCRKSFWRLLPRSGSWTCLACSQEGSSIFLWESQALERQPSLALWRTSFLGEVRE